MRNLDTKTLTNAGREWAGAFLQPSRFSEQNPEIAIAGKEWVLQSLYNADFKDEFEFVVGVMKKYLGTEGVKELEVEMAERCPPRAQDVFEQLLEEKLAIRPNGERIEGKVGTVQLGNRILYDAQGLPLVKTKTVNLRNGKTATVGVPITEPVYAGQEELLGMGAQVMNISAECALLGLDAIVDNLDEGTGAAVIQGRSGVQPADPDAATTGTLLFTLTMSATAFGAAADQADGTVDAVAATITDDTSADATATLGYCRVSSTNDGATPLDDHIDGEAGTSGADFNFNTVSIVSGANISMSSYTITLSQGSTAT